MRGGNAQKTERARALRRGDYAAEDALRSELRARRPNGYKFVRQLPIGPYFADFACRERMLVVEFDGSQHVGRAVLDTIVAVLDGTLEKRSVSAEMKFLPAMFDLETRS